MIDTAPVLFDQKLETCGCIRFDVENCCFGCGGNCRVIPIRKINGHHVCNNCYPKAVERYLLDLKLYEIGNSRPLVQRCNDLLNYIIRVGLRGKFLPGSIENLQADCEEFLKRSL